MRLFISRLMRDRSGTSLIGYALVVTAISIALTVAAIPLRGAMEQASIRLESGLSIASGLHEADKEQKAPPSRTRRREREDR